jgi:hypothetical protein
LGILCGDHLTLLGDADLSLHSARGLREDRLIAWTASTTDRSAAAVKQTQRDAPAAERVDKSELGLVEFPTRGQKAAVLVAIGVTQHHLLRPSTAFQEAKVLRQGKELIHNSAAVAQIGDCLEQRDDIQLELVFSRPQ